MILFMLPTIKYGRVYLNTTCNASILLLNAIKSHRGLSKLDICIRQFLARGVKFQYLFGKILYAFSALKTVGFSISLTA